MIEIRSCHLSCTAEDHALLAVQHLQAGDHDRACDELCAALQATRDAREEKVLHGSRPMRPIGEVLQKALEQIAARVGG